VKVSTNLSSIFSLVAVIFFTLSLVNSLRAREKRKIPCETPANESSCYWIQGRLGAYSGTPAFRLWKIGTHRLLGILSGPSFDLSHDDLEDNEHPEFPLNVQEKFHPTENRIFADFKVCPLEPQHPHAMQAACIEAARNIVVKN
jgi:hypothetical protein